MSTTQEVMEMGSWILVGRQAINISTNCGRDTNIEPVQNI